MNRPDTDEDGDDLTEREAAEAVDDAPATKVEGHGRPKPREVIARGGAIGRYIILDKIGEGGMGVVYGAYDPELDRKVAIKLLQVDPAGGSTSGDGAWLLREAQALARLQHPNVVAVYDVGTLPPEDREFGPEGRVFVAMELVDGATMRAWHRAKPRSWREVLDVMREAGAGLAAAHRAGLVHRDFKPDNILVGNDGHARVMDFGLARLRAGDDHSPPPSTPAPISPAPGTRDVDPSSERSEPQFTFAGSLVGTPAYMAPELLDGRAADARADQFAFGVSLFEALYGQRPYGRRDLAKAKTAPPKLRIPDIKRPARLVRIALRAIALDPAARYPSMDDLLAELAVDPTAGRRRALIAGGVVLAAGAAVVGTYAFASHGKRTCIGTEQRLAKIWDGDVKARVHAAFAATKKPFAEASFAGLVRALDGYTTSWTAAVTDSCKATRERGEQSEQVMSLREACYASSLDELRALSALLEKADGTLVESGDKVVAQLDPLAKCANIHALMAPGQVEPSQREQARVLEQMVHDAKAAMIAGEYLPAMVKAQQVVTGAQALGYEPLVAEAMVLRGTSLLIVQNYPEAQAAFGEATYAAIRGKRDDIAAEAGLAAGLAVVEAGGRADLARVWFGHAMAAAARAGILRDIDQRRLEVEGLIDADSGDHNAAIAAHEKALAAAKATLGEADPGVIEDEILLATTLSKAGAWQRAVPHYVRALELREAGVGPNHPDIATLATDLGAAYTHAGDYPKAHAAFARAIAIREAVYGKQSPILIATLDNYGELLRHEGDFAGALAAQQRALAMARVVPGRETATFHQLATDTCDTLIAAGKFADAHALFDEVFALEVGDSTVRPATQSSRAELALAEHKWPEAVDFANKAIAGYESAGGKDDPQLWRPLTALGRAEAARGDAKAARAALERAVTIGQHAAISETDLAPTREALAKLPAEQR